MINDSTIFRSPHILTSSIVMIPHVLFQAPAEDRYHKKLAFPPPRPQTRPEAQPPVKSLFGPESCHFSVRPFFQEFLLQREVLHSIFTSAVKAFICSIQTSSSGSVNP